MLTALVIDEAPAARTQVTGLLELAGWTVHEAADAEDARWLAAVATPDLVVTAAVVPGVASGTALLHELRRAGSTARLLVVTPEPTLEQRAEAIAAGALACLAAPLDASVLLRLLSRRPGAAPRAMVDVEDLHDDDLDAELLDRLQGMYADALPTRFSAIDRGARAGDPRAVAAAAHTLAGTSGQLGHPDVAELCQAIATDARRGILAHALVSRLAVLAGVDRRAGGRRTTAADRAVPARQPERQVAGIDRRRLALVADAFDGSRDAGLVHAVDAVAGRLSARRADPFA